MVDHTALFFHFSLFSVSLSCGVYSVMNDAITVQMFVRNFPRQKRGFFLAQCLGVCCKISFLFFFFLWHSAFCTAFIYNVGMFVA